MARQLRASVIRETARTAQRNSIDVGVGTMQATNQQVFEAVQPAVSDLRDWVKQQPTFTWMNLLGGAKRVDVGSSQLRILSISCGDCSRAELVSQLGTVLLGDQQ